MEYMFSLALGTPLPCIDSGFDWNCFFAFAEKNRLETLCAAGAAKLPHKPDPLNRLHLQAQQLTARTIQQIQLLAFLTADFQQSGIRVLSMKGPLLAAELYGDPSLRQSNDLDLLVCEADYEAAKDRLLTMGFTEHIPPEQQTQQQKKLHHKLGEDMHGIFLKNGLCVELHWRISFRYPIDFEDLWTNREEKMLLGQPIFCLGRIDNLVYLICHAAGHGYSRLRWLIDLYKLFTDSNVNYTELYLAMKQRNSEVFLLETLLLLYLIPSFRMPTIANEYFSLRREGSLVHYKFHEDIQTAALRACHLTDLLEPLIFRSQDPSGIPERNYMHMLPVVGKKVTVFTYIHKLMQPKRAELERFHFPDSLYFLYYIVRPFYKLWRCTPFYKGIYK
jgi:hypothetical protein